jgi:hypothetical protein
MAVRELRRIDVHASTDGGLFLASAHRRHVTAAPMMQHV